MRSLAAPRHIHKPYVRPNGRSLATFGEAVGRGEASYDECLAALLAAAGNPLNGSDARTRISWDLHNAIDRWQGLYARATARALSISRSMLEAGETDEEAVYAAAIAAADSLLPACHSRESLQPLLHQQWLGITRSTRWRRV